MVKKIGLIWLGYMLFSPLGFAKTTVDKVDSDIQCMVRTAQAEAENQSKPAKIGVLYVIHNRVKQRHKSYCTIVNEKSQFSHRRIKSAKKCKHQYMELYNLAKAVMDESVEDVTNGATFFHDDSLTKNPFRRTKRTIKLDNMVFYRSTKTSSA